VGGAGKNRDRLTTHDITGATIHGTMKKGRGNFSEAGSTMVQQGLSGRGNGDTQKSFVVGGHKRGGREGSRKGFLTKNEKKSKKYLNHPGQKKTLKGNI